MTQKRKLSQFAAVVMHMNKIINMKCYGVQAYIRTFALSAWTLSLWSKVSEKINNIIHSSLLRILIFACSMNALQNSLSGHLKKKTEQYFDSHKLTQGKWL